MAIWLVIMLALPLAAAVAIQFVPRPAPGREPTPATEPTPVTEPAAVRE